MNVIQKFRSYPKAKQGLILIGFVFVVCLIGALINGKDAHAQIAGRNPTPEHFFSVRVVDEAGRTVGGANLAALPPIGYTWQGREIVGGSIDRAQRDTPQTSVNLTQATVIVK